jgi:hypothetical protein
MLPDPEIPYLKMLIRARNAVWMSKRAIGIRGFRGLDVATIFCNHLAKLLQKIVASQKNQLIASVMLLLSFVIILQTCYKRS